MGMQSISGIFTHISLEWLIVGIFAAVIALSVAAYGARYAIAISLALPIAAFLNSFIPDTAFLSSIVGRYAATIGPALVFFGLFVILFLILSRIDTSYGAELGSPLPAAIAGVACTAVALTVWMYVPALHTLHEFNPQIQAIFALQYRFWWLLGSLAALAFVRS